MVQVKRKTLKQQNRQGFEPSEANRLGGGQIGLRPNPEYFWNKDGKRALGLGAKLRVKPLETSVII